MKKHPNSYFHVSCPTIRMQVHFTQKQLKLVQFRRDRFPSRNEKKEQKTTHASNTKPNKFTRSQFRGSVEPSDTGIASLTSFAFDPVPCAVWEGYAIATTPPSPPCCALAVLDHSHKTNLPRTLPAPSAT